MLALSVALTTLSDLAAVGQPAATPDTADSFLALLNSGSSADSDPWTDNGELTATDGNTAANQAAANNPVETPVNVPTTIFAANAPSQQDTQNGNAPAQRAESSSANASNNQDNQAQNALPAQTEPQQSSNAGSKNQSPPTAGQSSSANSSQAGGGNINQAAQQLRSRLKDQLGNISQILLGMIQGLSTAATQAVQQAPADTTAPATAQSPVDAAGNDTAGSAVDGAMNAQEIALLKDMQSLLQQLQQSLPGQGQDTQSNQNNGQPLNSIQTLTDSLLSDMTKLSQLVNPSSKGNNNSANSADNSLLGAAQSSGGLNNLLTSIAQAKAQLQDLNTANETVFAQAKADFQTSLTDSPAAPKTLSDNKDISANTTALTTAVTATTTVTTTAATPVIQDGTVKPLINNLQFTAPAPVLTTIAQSDGGNTDSGNQGQGQNQTPPPAIGAVSSTPASADTSTDSSFARILNQVSPSDVLNQIQFQVKTALSDGSSKISIQLNPPDLGKVDVKLTISADGKTSGIMITADNKNTLDLLQRDTQGLTRALNDAGLSTDSGSLNFSLGGGQQNQGQANQQAAASTYQQAQPEEDNAIVTNTLTRNYVVNLTDGLDITI